MSGAHLERWALARLICGLISFYAICLVAYRGDFTTKRTKFRNYCLIAFLGAFALFCGFIGYLI